MVESVQVKNNIAKIKKLFSEYNIDAYLVPSTDEYLGEYTTDHSNRLQYSTGFTGSNGLALLNAIGKDYFFTDGRYLIQAKKELGDNFEICETARYSVKTHLDSFKSIKVGFCPKLHNSSLINSILGVVELIPIEDSLIDVIWQDRPERYYSDIFLHEKYSGETTESKKNRVLELMQQDGVGAYVITDPHAVCWLLNIRGRDLTHTPIILASAILHQNSTITLFADNGCDENITSYFRKNKISVTAESDFYAELKILQNRKVAVSAKSSYALETLLLNAIRIDDYCDSLKCIKNEVELEGTILAHKKDARAVSRLLRWVKEQEHEFTELDVVDKALEFRKKEDKFFCPSFPTIAGFNGNGSIVHYRPEEHNNAIIKKNGILLVDSGGQYLEGTTDITRTIAIGAPTEEQIHNFTLVLKGMINVASAKFSIGTTGADLDQLAREHLLAEGKDYAHGTGHGVGSFLSVHEGPQSIAKGNNIALRAGMIVSIEPGFYKEGEYGIRVENLAYVKESSSKDFLEFGILTLVPIDENLIDFSMLTETERGWFDKYQALAIK